MAQAKPFKWRKFAIQGVTGAVIGAAGIMTGKLVLKPLVASGAISAPSGPVMAAATVGLCYLLMALLVGSGVAGPRIGVHYLNMEDEEELRQQRTMLAYATAGMAAMGIGLIVLALAGPGGVIAAPMALAISLGLLAASIPLTLLQWRHMDELMRRVTTETGNMTYYLLLLVGGGWAILAHLGYARAPTPLDWLTMLFGLVLLASFIAAGRRGMLAPR